MRRWQDTTNPRSVDRTTEVWDLLTAEFGDPPCNPHPSVDFYAVELWTYSKHGAVGMAERDQREAAMIRTLEDAGYVIHDGPCCGWHDPYTRADPDPDAVFALPALPGHRRRYLLAYRPEWGHPLPRAHIWPMEAADYLGYNDAPALTAAAEAGEIPDLRNDRGDWPVLELDRIRAEQRRQAPSTSIQR